MLPMYYDVVLCLRSMPCEARKRGRDMQIPFLKTLLYSFVTARLNCRSDFIKLYPEFLHFMHDFCYVLSNAILIGRFLCLNFLCSAR